jgi:transposase
VSTRKVHAVRQAVANCIPGWRWTISTRFVRWRRAGVWGRIIDALAAAHDAAVQMIDTSIVCVHQHGSCTTRNQRQSMGRSRGGLTSKIHAVVDSNGLPVRLALSPGEAHDVRLAGKLLSRLKSGSMLLADRGYDADWIRELAMKKGAWANIQPKSNRSDPICFSPYLYRARNHGPVPGYFRVPPAHRYAEITPAVVTPTAGVVSTRVSISSRAEPIRPALPRRQ